MGMHCPSCKSKCYCVDSRSKLPYGLLDKEDFIEGETPIKQRKYVCKQCSKSYITSEYLVEVYESTSKDKRTTTAERSSGAETASRKNNKEKNNG
jgi:hypothetical protein